MSVSDESNGSAPQPKGESRKAKRARVRARYESSEFSLRELAKLENVPESTIFSWSKADGWRQRKRLVAQAARKLEAQLDEKALAHVKDQLTPFIEAHKVKITKRGVRIGNLGLSRIEQLWRKHKPSDAKAEADGARAADILLRMARVSLGMDDGKTNGGSLSLRILTGQTAVELQTA